MPAILPIVLVALLPITTAIDPPLIHAVVILLAGGMLLSRIRLQVEPYVWLGTLILCGWGLFQAIGTGIGHAAWAWSPEPARIALDPMAAVTGAMLFPAVLVFAAVAQAMDARTKETAINVIMAAGCLHAITALALLPFEGGAHAGSVTGLFANRNHLADWMMMPLFLAAARAHRHPEGSLEWVTISLCGLALMASQSRMGLVAATLGMLWILRQRRASAAVFLLVCGLALLIAWIGAGERWMLIGPNDTRRDEVYLLSLRLIFETPWTGLGVGGFKDGFEVMRAGVLEDPLTWTRAHNIYLEAAAELGLPAFLLLGLVLTIGLRSVFCRTHRRTAMAAQAATMALALHGLTDFSPSHPAIAILWLIVCGLSCHGAENRNRISGDSSGQS